VDNPNGIERRAIVPNRVADVLMKVLAQGEAEFRLALGDPNLHASFGRGELAAKVIEGTYPEYRSALNLPAKVQVTFKKNDLLTAARSAALMTDRNTMSVIFRFDEGKVSIATQSAEIGESKIEVPISLRGSPIDVRFNPAYLIDALRTLNEEEIRMEFADHEKPAVVRGAQHYRHLVMPLVTVGG
jgi:DNA polymerase-3 subunit beta